MQFLTINVLKLFICFFCFIPRLGITQDFIIWPEGEKPVDNIRMTKEKQIAMDLVHNEFEIALINLPQNNQKEILTKIQNLSL
jgi:hypothetical protein